LPIFDTEQLQNLNLSSQLSILADGSNCKWGNETADQKNYASCFVL